MPSAVLKTLSAAMLAAFSVSAFAADPCTDCFAKRWIYFGGNLTLGEDFDAVKVLIDRAYVEGYNGIALNSGGDGGYPILFKPESTKSTTLRKNLQALKDYAAKRSIELIPVGGGPHTPVEGNADLVEALPATTAYKVATDSDKVAVANAANLAAGGAFDVAPTDSAQWGWDSAWVAFDPDEGHVVDGNGKGSLKMRPSDGSTKLANGDPNYNSRVRRTLTLDPHKAYRLSFWLKAGAGYPKENLFIQILDANSDNVPAYRNGLGWGTAADGNWNAKSNAELFAAAGQAWTRYELTFNTGNFNKVNVWFSNQRKGDPNTAVWLDDVEVREVGLSHPVRRASLPLKVTSGDGKAPYVEGSGGDYEVDAANETLKLTARSRIQRGADLLVSWYQSGESMTTRWGTAATACSADYFTWQKKQYDQLYPYFTESDTRATAKYFLYYDEIRLMNWDPTCQNRSAADYLAGTVNRAAAELTGYGKPVEVLTWNDMFDPNMNAVEKYWQVNGDLRPGGVKLASGIGVVNWTGGEYTTDTENAKRAASLDYFKEHKQVVALYYDHLPSVDSWLGVLAQKPDIAVDGFLYATWKDYGSGNKLRGYDDVANVADKMRAKYGVTRWPARKVALP